MQALAFLGPIAGGVTSSVMEGNAKASEYASEAALAQRQAQDVDLQAKEASASARANLQAGLSAISARRAAANVGLDSPTAQAIEKNYTMLNRNSENINAVGFGNQQYSLLAKSAMDQQAGQTAEMMGWLNAGQKLFSGFSSLGQAYG